MKHFSSILLIVLLGFSINLHAVTYCSSAAFGYGASATGGGNATPTLVSTVSGLQSALNKGKNKVIIITASLTFTSMLSVQDGANVTLMALPGVTLSSNQQDATSSGILYVKRFDNLIIRNITFIGPGAYDCDGNDLLCFEKVTNAWVDHCDFQDGVDGNFDNKSLSDSVTVSWCRFRYLKAPRARECDLSNSECQKLTDDHRFTNLLGSSADDKPSDGTYNFTWAYCWWDDGCKERMVRCRNASLHFLNCYWNSSVANYYIGPQNADAYVEGCYIEGNPSKDRIFYQNYNGTNGVKFINCYSAKGVPSNVTNRTVLTPNYSYTALSYSEAKSAVTNSSCGAGATLTVTTSGAVSSSCDGGGGQAAPTLTLTSGQANQTVDLGDPISNIVYTASGTANDISVANLPAGLTSSKSGLVLTISGTPTATGTYTVTATNSSGVTNSLQGTITVNDGSGGYPGGGGSNNYIYYWQMSGTTAYATNSSHDALPSGCTLYAGTTDDSQSFSIESAAYVSGVPESMQAANGRGIKMGANALYLKATLASGNFQAGDTIFVCGYNAWKISTTSSQTGDVIAALTTGSSKTSYQVGYVILSTNTSELYFMRANGSGTGITAIKVCRPASAPAAPTLTLTSGQADQTVTSGNAITNIVYTASGTANDISVANLPAGLTSSKSGLVLTISGTPTATGTYTVTATNSIGATTTLQGTITVNPSGSPTCNLHLWFNSDADRTAAGITQNSEIFTTSLSVSNNAITGSVTIDEVTYNVTSRTSNSAPACSFTIPTGYSATFYMIAVSSGTGTRTVTISTDGGDSFTNTDQVIAGSKTEGTAITLTNLTAGSYVISASGNIGVGMFGLKLCSGGIEHTVTFKDSFGNTLKTEMVSHGGAATAPTIPDVACYTPGEWDKAFNNVTSDLIVTVTYTLDRHSVTLQYEDTEGSAQIQ